MNFINAEKQGEILKTKIMIFGYKEFSQLMNSVLDPYRNVATFKIVDAIVVSVSKVSEQIKDFNPDVVVSAGSNAAYLSSVLDIPVVSLESDVEDLIEAVTKASKVSDDILLINFKEPSPVISLLQQSLNVNVRQEIYNTPDQAREIFLVNQQGSTAYVGASYVCGLAADKDLPAFLTYSVKSCQNAIEKAINVAGQNSIYRNDGAMASWITDHLQQPVITYSENADQFHLNKAAQQVLRTQQLDDNGQTALLQAINDTTSGNGEVLLADQYWWYRVEKIVNNSRVHYIFQLTQKADTSEQQSLPQNQHQLVYQADNMKQLLSLARSYALSPSNVLILGESGCGKELIAREIYRHGPYGKGRFVALNCSAIPSELFESELFGYIEGAFTGSRKGGRKGLVEEANDGVLFLDEISELAPQQQAKLLRFLQERTYRPVGSNRELPVNVKLVAASNIPLKELVDSGVFRADLYYRLNVFNLYVPPLRLRRSDIPAIAEFKLQRLPGITTHWICRLQE